MHVRLVACEYDGNRPHRSVARLRASSMPPKKIDSGVSMILRWAGLSGRTKARRARRARAKTAGLSIVSLGSKFPERDRFSQSTRKASVSLNPLLHRFLAVTATGTDKLNGPMRHTYIHSSPYEAKP